MIHQLLHLTRPLIVLDTETTGVDPAKDRIVELGFQVWDAAGMTKEWRSLVNPGAPIPASATRVHGITDAMVQACRHCPLTKSEIHKAVDGHEYAPWPRFRDLAANLAKGFVGCDFAGKNARFDLRIVAAEMARAGVEWDYAGARIVDADRLEQLAVPRDLGSLHEKYTGKKHDGAHGALSDVRATVTVIVGQLYAYPNLPRDLEALHAAQWPGWIDEQGKFKFVDGIPCFSNWGKYANRPMTVADAGYWDFILSNDFPADVKALAAGAKLGRFPEAKP